MSYSVLEKKIRTDWALSRLLREEITISSNSQICFLSAILISLFLSELHFSLWALMFYYSVFSQSFPPIPLKIYLYLLWHHFKTATILKMRHRDISVFFLYPRHNSHALYLFNLFKITSIITRWQIHLSNS